MRLTTVFVRFYKSFNYDYERRAHTDAKRRPWEILEDGVHGRGRPGQKASEWDTLHPGRRDRGLIDAEHRETTMRKVIKLTADLADERYRLLRAG